MRAIWTRRLVDLLIAVFALAFVGILVRMGGAIAEGKFDMLSWPASNDHFTAYVLGDPSAWWDARDGDVRVLGQPLVNGIQYALFLLNILLGAVALWRLRGFLARTAKSEVFSDANVAALRGIAWLLLTIAAVSVIRAALVQWTILDNIPPIDGKVVRSSLSLSVTGVQNIELKYSPPLITLLLALIAFITAGAFRSGKNFRDDSESVV